MNMSLFYYFGFRAAGRISTSMLKKNAASKEDLAAVTNWDRDLPDLALDDAHFESREAPERIFSQVCDDLCF